MRLLIALLPRSSYCSASISLERASGPCNLYWLRPKLIYFRITYISNYIFFIFMIRLQQIKHLPSEQRFSAIGIYFVINIPYGPLLREFFTFVWLCKSLMLSSNHLSSNLNPSWGFSPPRQYHLMPSATTAKLCHHYHFGNNDLDYPIIFPLILI